MRLRFFATLLLCTSVPFAAAAQTTLNPGEPTVRLANGSTEVSFNKANCDANQQISVSYSYDEGFIEGSKVLIFGTGAASCPSVTTAPDANKVLLNTTLLNTANQSGTHSIDSQTLFDGQCPDNTADSFLICVITTQPSTSGSGDAFFSSQFVTVTYDSKQPSAPTGVSVEGGDSALFIRWSAQSDVASFTVYFRAVGPPPSENTAICFTGDEPDAGAVGGGQGGQGMPCDSGDCGDTGPEPPDAAAPGLDAGPPPPAPFAAAPWCAEWAGVDAGEGICGRAPVSATTSSYALRNLHNDQQYEIVLVAVDAAGNVSAGSAPAFGRPRAVNAFFQRYRCAGGVEQGGFGCSTAGAVLLPVAALLAIALVVRRRMA